MHHMQKPNHVLFLSRSCSSVPRLRLRTSPSKVRTDKAPLGCADPFHTLAVCRWENLGVLAYLVAFFFFIPCPHVGGGMMSGFASTIAQGFAFGTGSAVAHRVSRCFGTILDAPQCGCTCCSGF